MHRGSVLDSLHWRTHTGFSADPVAKVPPGEDLVHEISSAHSSDIHPGRISRSVVQHTEKYSGSPYAEYSSLNTSTPEQKPAPEEEMVDFTMLVLGHTKCFTETEVNDGE